MLQLPLVSMRRAETPAPRPHERSRTGSGTNADAARFHDRDVLELACGDGAFCFEAADLGARSVTGVDSDRERIDAARETARTRPGPVVPRFIHTGDPGRIPLASASVDVILVFDLLDRLAEWRAVLAECRRVLRDPGAVLVRTRRLARRHFERATAESGLQVVRRDARGTGGPVAGAMSSLLGRLPVVGAAFVSHVDYELGPDVGPDPTPETWWLG